MREAVPIVGVWDDHDFGLDNQGKYYKNKGIQKEMYLNFIQEPKDSKRRNDTFIEGTYWDYYVENVDNTIKAHLVLLDLRYNMEHEVEALG